MPLLDDCVAHLLPCLDCMLSALEAAAEVKNEPEDEPRLPLVVQCAFEEETSHLKCADCLAESEKKNCDVVSCALSADGSLRLVSFC